MIHTSFSSPQNIKAQRLPSKSFLEFVLNMGAFKNQVDTQDGRREGIQISMLITMWSKDCQNMVLSLSKCGQKIVEMWFNICQNMVKNCQNMVQNLSKCGKKMAKKLNT